MCMISIVVPCYNEQEAIPVYYEAVVPIMGQMKPVEFEIIFVDDGSSDASLPLMRKLASQDSRVQYLSFSKNFGKEAALYAGLEHAKGDYVAVMDVDLQDPVDLLPEMYRHIQSPDCDCVAAKRDDRKGEGKIRSFLSEHFYHVINRISQTEIVSGARDYRLMTRQMVDAVLEMKEYNRFSKGIFSWIGFRTEWIAYTNRKRSVGKTKWSLKNLLVYSLEGITGFTVLPLSLASIIGLLFCLLSACMICFIITRKLIFGDPVAGWTSLVCLIFLVSGVQLFCIGIIGEYLAKTYLESKRRPIYILRESSEVEHE
ncbi:MAG: glycosyltransferase family 2 protein [Eubacteriales bacterium]|nr:glycosyltransferase family 2 protein [Eubacteriales bacterium]